MPVRGHLGRSGPNRLAIWMNGARSAQITRCGQDGRAPVGLRLCRAALNRGIAFGRVSRIPGSCKAWITTSNRRGASWEYRHWSAGVPPAGRRERFPDSPRRLGGAASGSIRAGETPALHPTEQSGTFKMRPNRRSTSATPALRRCGADAFPRAGFFAKLCGVRHKVWHTDACNYGQTPMACAAQTGKLVQEAATRRRMGLRLWPRRD